MRSVNRTRTTTSRGRPGTAARFTLKFFFDKIQRENPISGEPPVYTRTFPRLSLHMDSRNVLRMLPVYAYAVTAYGVQRASESQALLKGAPMHRAAPVQDWNDR